MTQLEDLKALTIKTPFGVMNKKGFSATFSQIGYVSIPFPMAKKKKKICSGFCHNRRNDNRVM